MMKLICSSVLFPASRSFSQGSIRRFLCSLIVDSKLGDIPSQSNESGEKNGDLSAFLSRYSSLRPADRLKLFKSYCEENQDKIHVPKWSEVRQEDLDELFCASKRAQQAQEEERRHEQKVKQKLKPSYLRRRKIMAKRMTPSEDPRPIIVSECFTPEMEEHSLVEDYHKAEIYESICRLLNNQWKIKSEMTDRFFEVMTNSIRDDLLDQSRPILVNEFADFSNPYMMKRSAIKRLIQEKIVRNCLEETMVGKYLDSRPDIIKLRTEAKLPPEVLEPLLAFRGDVRYNFDSRTRLVQKLKGIKMAVSQIKKCETIENVLGALPENKSSDKINENHPFLNHFGFLSSVPRGYSGSIKMGRPLKPLQEELKHIRYPTLQRVAHSLPKDPKYRASASHAIKLLERSRGWDYESKLKAINCLLEVLNNMAPSSTYEQVLNKALPVIRRRRMCKKTRSQRYIFSQGLQYIRSITTQKPLRFRQQKKK